MGTQKRNLDKKVHLWIGSQLKADAQRLAQERDRSLASLIRQLLKREINNINNE